MKKNSLLDNSLPFCLKPREGRVSAPILSIPTDFSFVSFFFPVTAFLTTGSGPFILITCVVAAHRKK